MINHLPGDIGHIRYLSCKDIQIFPEKSDEHKFLFGLKAYADLELLVWVARVDWDFVVISLLLQIHRLIGRLLV
jgi:hypothetical protein